MTRDLLQIRSFGISFFVLRDRKGLYLIDGGFIGGRRVLTRRLRQKGWENEPVLGILLTHGHLDHILNVSEIAKESGAWIYGPALDLSLFEGRHVYDGASRVAGLLEALAKSVLNFKAFSPDRLLSDGEFLDLWMGLQVIQLSGHTAGHCGYYSAESKLLFSGDLFASFGEFTHLPPAVFNHDSHGVHQSVRRALELDLCGVYPCHSDGASPAVHLERLKTLAQRIDP